MKKLKKCECGGEILRGENAFQWMQYFGVQGWTLVSEEPEGNSVYICEQCDKKYSENELEWEKN